MPASPLFTLSPAWKTAYPAACAGVLALRDVSNPAQHAVLEQEKAALEAELRSRWGGQEREALFSNPTLQAYAAYYRRG